MNDQRFYNVVAAVAAIVVIGAFVASAAGAELSSAGTPAPSAPAAAPGAAAYVYLSINGNPDIRPVGADQYNPANFSVPAHTLLVFTITNYDNGENVIPPSYGAISGTVGNVEYLNGSTQGVSSVPTASVAHTFTFLGGAYAGFNVPVPAASATSPTVVVFDAYFNTTGVFTWQCMAPCNGPSMSGIGYMTGMMTVE